MNSVEPIKCTSEIKLIKNFLKDHSLRDYCLFLLGINTGIRLHELLHLKVSNVTHPSGTILSYLSLEDYKNPPIYLNNNIREDLFQYIQKGQLNRDCYLFPSKKTNEPMTRQQVYRILNEAASKAGIQHPVGMTTLRKTFGYHAYRKGIAISLIQKRLHHASSTETLQFIGVYKKSPLTVQLDVHL